MLTNHVSFEDTWALLRVDQFQSSAVTSLLEEELSTAWEDFYAYIYWVDLGWIPSAHQAILSLFSLNWTGGEKCS